MNRPLFNQRIDELERLLAERQTDATFLETLRDELAQRSTERARTLLAKVRGFLQSAPLAAPKTAPPTGDVAAPQPAPLPSPAVGLRAPGTYAPSLSDRSETPMPDGTAADQPDVEPPSPRVMPTAAGGEQPSRTAAAKPTVVGATDGLLEGEDAKRVRGRAKRLFAFLKAYANLRRPVVTVASEEEWLLRLDKLEPHTTIGWGAIEGADTTLAPYLTVRRALPKRPPAPPLQLVPWLEGGTDDPEREPGLKPAITSRPDDGESVTERFDDQPERVMIHAEWLERWRRWAAEDRPARRARRVYDELFKLKGRLDREGENLELLVANGWLRLRTAEGAIDYPILLQRVALEFDPDVPEFRLNDADRDAELQLALLQRIPGINAALLAQLREELEANDYHPLGEHAAAAWLRSIIRRLTPDGDLLEGTPPPAMSDRPVLMRTPLMLLRRRASGVPEAMDRALRALEKGGEVPGALWRITGVDDAPADARSERRRSAEAPATVDPLLSKPANEEQIDLIRQLETRGAVLVQGPPGTGKSHTIANLIGHLVATGQRVLITSHTTKALRVLRDHVVRELRPLCVSVLDNDLEGRRQLEEAIGHIQAGIQRPSDQELERQAAEHTARRAELQRQIEQLRQDLLTVRELECTPIALAGEQIAPIDAAKLVRRDAALHGWLPAPVHADAPLPLSVAECRDLYATSGEVTPREEAQLALPLPEVGRLLDPPLFAAMVDRASRPMSAEATAAFRAPVEGGDATAESRIAAGMRGKLEELAQLQPWERELVASSVAGDARLEEWRQFAELVDISVALWRQIRTQVIESEPELPADMRQDEIQQVLEEILRTVGVGERLKGFTRLLHPRWKPFLRGSRVNGHEPVTHDDFQALAAMAKLRASRERLRKRWNAQAVPVGLPAFEQFSQRPEEDCEPVARDLQSRLAWWGEAVTPLITAAEARHLHWSRLLAALPRGAGRFAELERLSDALRGAAVALEARAVAEEVVHAERTLEQQRQYLTAFTSPVAVELAHALSIRSAESWAAGLAALRALLAKCTIVERRRQLLARLEPFAATWADAIQRRVGVHGAAEVPGDPVLAWRWCQLHQELERRGLLDERALGRALEQAERQHRAVTAELITARTWRALRSRTGRAQQQALVGWADLMRRVGKGTGKRAPALLAEARKQLEQARDAVPVWIMPLSRVFETINPETTRFDVVVIDEASQADVTAIFALFLGTRVVVVGDHEQVSPDAVGERTEDVDRLIDQYLEHVPNAKLYVGATSIYDLARQSFPGQLRLVEHFRCVREIIEFSNRLSYNGEIKPLRESAAALAPHLVEHCVAGVRASEKINRVEANAIVSLLAAATEQPEYEGKSMGVVSLLGEEQAVLIDEQLRRRLAPTELQKRKVVCGNAAQFQGDERDVMFLTMVDAPQGGPLTLRARDQFKQRYNVAASRARDQLWLVHSLDPGRDLKPDDLRFQLIQHVRDPSRLASEESRAMAATESPFEAEVLRRLVNAGYRVRTQFPVGAYRIDIVVQGDRGRMAIECDGERFHPRSALERDLARQAVLERLGWRFIRIRGSRYFRDPDATMAAVVEMLEERGIRPLGPEGADAPVNVTGGAELLERVRRRAAELLQEWEG